MLRLVSVLLVILGVVAGTFSDPLPATPPSERDGYKIVEADFHVHSRLGDGILSPFGLVLAARRQGLHAIAITDHNQVWAAQWARWFSNLIGGPTILVGEEITASGFHMIGVGLRERVSWRQSASEAIEEIHRQGGVAIAAHPTRKWWAAYDENVVRELDAAEVMHPVVFVSGDRGEQVRDFYRRAEANGHSLTAVGSSDYHWFNSLGLCRTYIFVQNNDEREILDALRDGRTVVYDPEGNAFGKPELIELLQGQPVRREAGDYNYSGSGLTDLVGRTCGWLGLLGLVLFRRSTK